MPKHFGHLGAKEFKFLFHDGRLSKSNLYENGYNSPAEEWLPKGLTNLLAAQDMFPVPSQFEMAGTQKKIKLQALLMTELTTCGQLFLSACAIYLNMVRYL